MIGLIVKSPLTNYQVGPTILDSLDHILEIFLLLLIKPLVGLLGRYVKLVLSLGLGRLKRAGQDAHFGILDGLGHLRVGDILVDDNAVDKLGVLERSTRLTLHPDHVKVYVIAVEIGNVQNGIHRNLGHLALVDIDNFGTERRHGGRDEGFGILAGEFHPIADLVQRLDRDLGRLFESLGNAHGMDSPSQQLLGLLQQSAGQNDDARGAIANLVILRGRQLDHQLANLIGNLHLSQDGGTVVGDGNVAVGTDHDLVHALGSQGGPDDAGDGPSGKDVGLGGLDALDSSLGLLLLQNDEGPTVFIVYHRHD
mmetsp:Transcript_24712/g.53848  ORF Transcript_24712/g.53848 Transcript_24712/m.53848 type:complete len:310 (-) Transcript_24712:56-985(-)